MSLNKVYFEINNITEEEYLKQLEEMPTTNETQQFYKQVLLEFYKSGIVDYCCISLDTNRFNYLEFKKCIKQLCFEFSPNEDEEFKLSYYRTVYNSFFSMYSKPETKQALEELVKNKNKNNNLEKIIFSIIII